MVDDYQVLQTSNSISNIVWNLIYLYKTQQHFSKDLLQSFVAEFLLFKIFACWYVNNCADHSSNFNSADDNSPKDVEDSPRKFF